MSWNNVIPAAIVNNILDQIDKEPKQIHFDKDLFPPCYTIKEEYLTSCNEAFTWITSTGYGPSGTLAKAVDHPAFAALRQHLATRGYIEMQTKWVNGDRVLKPFCLNEVYFGVGDKFYSASAMSGHIITRKKYGKE